MTASLASERHPCDGARPRELRRRLSCRVRGVLSLLTASRTERRGYRSILRAVTVDEGRIVSRPPTQAQLVDAAADERVRAVFAEELVPGALGPQALVRCVRRLAEEGQLDAGEAMASAARRITGLYEASHAAAAVLGLARGRLAEAEDHLRGVSRASALDLVPVELVAVEVTGSLQSRREA